MKGINIIMDDAGLGLFRLLVELAGIHQLSEILANYHGLEQVIKNMLSIVGVFTVVFGILQCFLGYKLFKFWCGLIGLVVGSVLGLFLAATGVFSGSSMANLVGVLVIILLALIGAYTAFRLYLVGLFIYAFSVAFLVGFYLLALITDSINAGLFAGLAAGLALGIVAVIHHRFWIIVTTSVSGGMSIGTSLIMVLQSTEAFWIFLLPPVFIIAGFIVQTLTVKKGPGKSSGDDAAVTAPLVYAPAPPPPAYPTYPYPDAQSGAYPQNSPYQYDPDAPTAPLPQTMDTGDEAADK